MANSITTAVTTAHDLPRPSENSKGRKDIPSISTDGKYTVGDSRSPAPKKYRHVKAFHAAARPSCLSIDAEKAPNFLGFRNLMALMLSMLSEVPIVLGRALTLTSRNQPAIND